LKMLRFRIYCSNEVTHMENPKVIHMLSSCEVQYIEHPKVSYLFVQF